MVRAEGVSEAFYNKQRDRVVEAVRAEAEERVRQAKVEVERERGWAEYQKCKSDRLQKQSVEAFIAELKRKPGMIRRACSCIGTCWAYIWAVESTVWDMIVCKAAAAWAWLGVALFGTKMVEYIWRDE